MFRSVSRQGFRRYFQPSRIVLALLADKERGRVNAITLCFHMHCSYKPPMMAFSIFHAAHSYSLAGDATHCVLSVPGERMAEAALFCGVESGKESNKLSRCGLSFVESKVVSVPSLREAIANVELRITQRIPSGDHLTLIGEVLNFSVDSTKDERCLISVGPLTEGYHVIASRGIHRIAVVDA